MAFALTGARLFDGERMRDGQSVVIQDDRITAVVPDGSLDPALARQRVPPEIVGRLTQAGVIVSAGHTAASYATIAVALRQGLTGFTHLFNAMPPLGHREPGPVGAALDDRGSWCGLIVDLHHVS